MQVSKRHDKWVESYNGVADGVMGWAGSNTADLLAQEGRINAWDDACSGKSVCLEGLEAPHGPTEN